MFQADMAYEDNIKRDNGVMGRVVFPIIVTLALASFIVLFNVIMMIMFGNIIYFTGMISLGICWFIYLKFKAFNNTEFEISLINEYFSVAKVERQKKRTELAEFSLRDCSHIGPTTEECFQGYIKDAAFKLNVTSTRKYEVSEDLWFCAVKGNGFDYVIIFEFRNPMYKFFRRFNPRNVFIMPMPKEEPEQEYHLSNSDDDSNDNEGDN